jgi:hypothetical protein
MNANKNYIIVKSPTKKDWFDIEQENLSYSDCSPTHHGLQCNHLGGTKEHTEILALCKEVVNLVKKIDKLNTLSE